MSGEDTGVGRAGAEVPRLERAEDGRGRGAPPLELRHEGRSRLDAPEADAASPRPVVPPDAPAVPAAWREADVRQPRHAHEFRLVLETVAASAVPADEARVRRGETLAEGETGRQRALAALAAVLSENECLGIVHAVRMDALGRPRYQLEVRGSVAAESPGRAARRAVHLRREVRSALALGFPQFGFRCLRASRQAGAATRPLRHLLRLEPARLELRDPARATAGFAAQSGPARGSLWLPTAPAGRPSFLDGIVAALLAARCEAEVRIEWTGRCLRGRLPRLLAEAIEGLGHVELSRLRVRVGNGPARAVVAAEAVEAHDWLQPWLEQGHGVDMRVTSASAAPLPEGLWRPLATEIWQGRAVAAWAGSMPAAPDEGLDLSCYLPARACLPPLLPNPASLARAGCRPHFDAVRLQTPATGTLLGDVPTPFADEPVRLGDRMQHCYVVGASGTGKSTLLLNMIAQDIAAGHGVGLLDPHGDLFQQVLERVPEHRRRDVVRMDFTDFDHLPGVNLLELKTARPELERNFIVQEMTRILQRLYGSVPESMGPMFYMYMRNALLLLMEDPRGPATLVDLPRVFADPAYRAFLLQHCTDEGVRQFWLGIASPATGDSSLSAMTPYIVNKFTEFTQNALVRDVVAQQRTTVDLRGAMDRRAILLVNLAKGLLSELDSRFLGMLMTGRLFAAAASRADQTPATRVPFHLYIDEFQNFTSDAVAAMLAEARKYGLALVLAHQQLGQLPEDVRGAALANTGSKVMFRVSCADAQELAPYIAPYYTANDLATLPDHLAMGRIKIANVPSPVFVMRTRGAVPVVNGGAVPAVPDVAPGSNDGEAAAAAVAARPACGDDFVGQLRFDDSLLDAASCATLAAEGVHDMVDLLAKEESERDAVLARLRSMTDRVVLRRLLRRV